MYIYVSCGIYIEDLVRVVGYKPLVHEMETCVGIKVYEKHIQSKSLNYLKSHS
jgi:hypothetical protein